MAKRKYRTLNEVSDEYYRHHPDEIDGYLDTCFESVPDSGAGEITCRWSGWTMENMESNDDEGIRSIISRKWMDFGIDLTPNIVLGIKFLKNIWQK